MDIYSEILGLFYFILFFIKKKSHSQNPPYPIEFHAILTTNEGQPHHPIEFHECVMCISMNMCVARLSKIERIRLRKCICALVFQWKLLVVNDVILDVIWILDIFVGNARRSLLVESITRNLKLLTKSVSTWILTKSILFSQFLWEKKKNQRSLCEVG